MSRRRVEGGERRSRRRACPPPMRSGASAEWSSGTFAIANGGFAALLMGSLGVGAGGCVLGFRAVLFDGQ